MPKDEAKPLTDARLAEIREEVASQRRFMETQARIVHLTPRHFVRIEEDLLAEIDRLRGVIAEASAEVGHMLDERTEDTQLLDWADENYTGHSLTIGEAIDEGYSLRDALRGARDGTLADEIYGGDDE